MSIELGLSVLDPSLYIPELRPKRKDSALQEMILRAHEAGVVREPSLLRETLSTRERVLGSGLGKGVAVPNARSLSVLEPRLVVARSRRGIAWGAPDDLAVNLVLLALSPPETSEEAHHEFLSRVVASTRLQRHRQKLLEATDFDAVATLLREVSA